MDETRVQDLLDEVERERNVKILFAVESGSRAWGLDSPKSDCDVRFVFTYPRDRYLTIQPPNDVIVHKNGEIELDSWELRKALGLLTKGNPTCMEWVFAQVVYRELDWSHWPGLKVLRDLAHHYFNPIATYYHYLHIASNNYKDYIRGRGEVPVKKLTHVFRGLFSAIWVLQNTTLPKVMYTGELTDPMPAHHFNTLMVAALPRVREYLTEQECDELVQIPAMKREGVDTMQEPAWLEPYLDTELRVLKDAASSVPKPLHQDFKMLDEFFRASLR